jgi:hypothetical protein
MAGLRPEGGRPGAPGPAAVSRMRGSAGTYTCVSMIGRPDGAKRCAANESQYGGHIMPTESRAPGLVVELASQRAAIMSARADGTPAQHGVDIEPQCALDRWPTTAPSAAVSTHFFLPQFQKSGLIIILRQACAVTVLTTPSWCRKQRHCNRSRTAHRNGGWRDDGSGRRARDLLVRRHLLD